MRVDRGGAGRSARWLAVAGGLVLAVVVGVAVVVQSTGGAACAAQAPPTGDTTHQGKASYYSTDGGGNCSYGAPPADGLFVALSPGEYADAAGCGGYLDVTGPKGKVRVQIVDQCPGCEVGHIDLSEKAFARIANLSDGIVSITYRAVVNPAQAKPLSFRFKDGTSRYWFAVLVLDHGNPLRSVEVRSGGGGWRRVSRADYNYWLADDGLGPGPFEIRVTDVYGQRATATGVRLSAGRDQRSGAYLYGRDPAGTPRPTPSGPTAGGSATGSPRPTGSPGRTGTPSPGAGATPSQPTGTPPVTPAEPASSVVGSRVEC